MSAFSIIDKSYYILKKHLISLLKLALIIQF